MAGTIHAHCGRLEMTLLFLAAILPSTRRIFSYPSSHKWQPRTRKSFISNVLFSVLLHSSSNSKQLYTYYRLCFNLLRRVNLYTVRQEKGTNFVFLILCISYLTETGEFFIYIKEHISYNSVYLILASVKNFV